MERREMRVIVRCGNGWRDGWNWWMCRMCAIFITLPILPGDLPISCTNQELVSLMEEYSMKCGETQMKFFSV
jgi:hypothetical protein